MNTVLVVLGIVAGVLVGGAIMLAVLVNYMCGGFWDDLKHTKK